MLRLGRAGRRADRGQPPRGDGAARPRSRRLPGPQPAPRLRPHDRLGPGRARWRRPPGTTSTTSRCRARCRCARPPRRAARAAGQPDRRLRRRRRVPRARPRGGDVGGGPYRARARSSTRRWSTAARCSPRCCTACWPRDAGATRRASNFADTGSPFYEVYECADGRHVAVGRHRAAVLRRARSTGLGPRRGRPPRSARRGRRGRRSRSASRRCSAPGPATSGRRSSPRATPASRRCSRSPRRRGTPTTWHGQTFVEHAGIVQPAPAPRFSRTPARSTARRRRPATTRTRSCPSSATRRPDRRLGAPRRRFGFGRDAMTAM